MITGMFWQRTVCAELFGELEAVEMRHVDVGDHEIA